jgi:hypothetical protein
MSKSGASMRAKSILLLGLVCASSCYDLVPVRRTALVPTAYAPTRGGAPLVRGQTSLSGEISKVESPQLSEPEVGDPGLLIPDLYMGGSLYHGVTHWLELGIQMRFSSFDWATPNIEGVLPFPTGREPNLLMYGAGFRLNNQISDTRTTLSAIVEFNGAMIYQTRFSCRDSNCNTENSADLSDSSLYRVDGFDESQVSMGSVFISQSTQISPRLSWSTLAGLERHYKNKGFDLTDEHNPLYSYLISVWGASVTYQHPRWSSTLTLFSPLAADPAIVFGPSLQLQTSFHF